MRQAARDPGHDRIWNSTAAYYDLYAANPGLMKCLVNHSEDFPGAMRVFQKLNQEWTAAVVASLKRRRATGELTDDELFRRAYAMGGMIDQYLTSLLLNHDPNLMRLSADRETTIDTLTELWRKGLLQ
jgi:hypothetical protein